MSTAIERKCRTGKCKRMAAPDRNRCEDCLACARRSSAKRRESAKNKGLCAVCQKQPPKPDKSRCQSCLDRYFGHKPKPPKVSKESERRRNARAMRVQAGLCFECGERPAKVDRTRCEECLYKLAEYQRRRYESKGLPRRDRRQPESEKPDPQAWYMTFRNNMPTMYEPVPTIEFLLWAPEVVQLSKTKSN